MRHSDIPNPSLARNVQLCFDLVLEVCKFINNGRICTKIFSFSGTATACAPGGFYFPFIATSSHIVFNLSFWKIQLCLYLFSDWKQRVY